MRKMIKRTSLITLLLFFISLSSCQSLFASPTPTFAPRPTSGNPTRTLAPTSTAIPTPAATATPLIQPTVVITPSGPAVCSVVPVLPPVNAEIDQLIPDPSTDDNSIGPESARIIIIEYTDFQCQICATLSMNLRELQKLYPSDVRVILRYLPLSKEHDKAVLAFQAVEAAALQNKYWEMHDLLFTTQSDWMSLSVKEFSAWVIERAGNLEMDKGQFADDLSSDEVVKKVFQDTQESSLTSLTNPPAVFFNKTQYQDWVDVTSLISMVEFYKLPDRAFNACPPMTIDPQKNFKATFETEKGNIIFELYPEYAPLAVNSFVYLARQKWYDNSPFYRVVPGYIIQAGDPTGSALGNPGYSISDEITPYLRFNQPGMLAMAHGNYGHVNGSQFFIFYGAVPEFDGQYTIIGKVIEGMDVLESLRPRDPYFDQILLPPDILISVTITEE